MIELSDIMQKLNWVFVTRITVEFILFIVFLKVIKKIIELFFTKIVSRIDDYETKRQYSTIKFLLRSIINTVVSLFFLTNLLEAVGVNMKPILATAGVFGVAIGFGAKRFVEDIITGLIILVTGQVRVGDYITIDNSTGTVEKVDLAMIRIRSLSGDVFFIRNGLVDKVINHTREFSNPIVEIPVSYNSDIRHVVEVLKDLCEELKNSPTYSPYILGDADIFAIDSFGDSSINLKVRLKTTTHEQWLIQRHFRIMVKEKFDELGISIPFNQLDLHLDKEIASAINK